MIPLKAVIFDYGNVLSLPQTMDDMAAMARVAGIATADMHRWYWQFRLAFDRGDLDEASYWSALASSAGVDFTPEQLREIIRLDNESWARPDPVMVRWAATLRASGVRTGVLSNMPVILRRYLTANAAWLGGFDHHTYSCDVHMIKPEAGIYEHSLRGLGVAAGEALFLDDREANVEGARRLGLHAMLFRSPRQIHGELEGRFAIPRIELS
ncbi:MAG: HAD family phosphatase [Bryobacteraceae bacterium]